VEPATATVHLQRLERDGLVTWNARGRCKFFRLASGEVVDFIESMMAVAPKREQLNDRANKPIRFARYCYDHLAGEMGTRITEVLVEKKLLVRTAETFELTVEGEKWFGKFGIDLRELRKSRRHFARPCLDWSERRDHLGGALGAALAGQMHALGWFVREPDSRVVNFTDKGRKGIERLVSGLDSAKTLEMGVTGINLKGNAFSANPVI
jgi:hypothetical protein